MAVVLQLVIGGFFLCTSFLRFSSADLSSISLSTITATPASSITLYVALNGDDNWSGRLPSPAACDCDGPLRTVQKAIDLAHASTTSPDPVTNILLRQGVYYISETLVVHGLANVYIGSFKGERATVSGGVVLEGEWQPIPNTRAQTRSSRNETLWSMRVRTQGQASWTFNQLWRGGDTRLTRARAPNVGSFYTIKSDLNGTLSSHGFVYEQDEVNILGTLDPTALSRVDVVLYRSWQASRRSLASVSAANHTAMLTHPAGIEPDGNSEGRFYIENFFEALDEPGEYFMDEEARMLHYCAASGENPSQHVFVAPQVVSNLLLLQDTTNITLADITFAHVDWNRSRAIQESGAVQAASFLLGAGIHCLSCKSCRIDHCEVC